MPDTQPTKAYSVRRVNPFLGVLQIIETDTGRAISANGVVWDIELGAFMNDEWGSLNRDRSAMAYYRYGLWSLEEGLVSRPLAAHLDSESLKRQADILIGKVEALIPELPLPLRDRQELWLFDRENRRPIALLASVADGEPRPMPTPKRWASAVSNEGLPSQKRFPRGDELEHLIKQRAGFNLHRRWITRQDNGDGLEKHVSDPIPANAFPPYLITQDWPDECHATLVKEFIAWIAPALLTLQQLTARQRLHLEQSLSIQAVSVEHHWRLYPRILDDALVKAARVQCRIQQSSF